MVIGSSLTTTGLSRVGKVMIFKVIRLEKPLNSASIDLG